MKANELMIDDWVMQYNNLQHVLRLCGAEKEIELKQ